MPLLARVSQTALGAGEASAASAKVEGSRDASPAAATAATDATVTGDDS